MTKLLIVESPTKTKTISKVLGKDYKVLASMGHLRDLPKSQFGVDIEQDFEPKYINVRGKGKTIKALREAAKKADMVYLATDPDREGEAISWHLKHLLDLDDAQTQRVTFHEITTQGVKEGMSHPRAIDQNLVDAQQARRVMDRIVGYQISPLLWKKVKSGLSAGRVQSVALKLIVEREMEIRAFVPTEYWSITAHHVVKRTSFTSEFYGKYTKQGEEKIDLSTEEDVQKVLDHLEDTFTVRSIEAKKRTRKPYAPFTTSTLQQEAARRLGFPAAKTMRLAQKLYEGIQIGSEGQVGLITYMRTDSTRLSQQFIGECQNFIQKHYGEAYATKGIRYGGKKGSQDAHEAIRPSSVMRTPTGVLQFLGKDEARLYELIWNRAVASQMPAARFEQTKIDLNNHGYLFRTTLSKMLFDGFQKIWPMAENEQKMPPLEENQQITAKKIDPQQHFTQPPARFNEASLVKALEENGVGRPSTYASIIQNVLTRNYVRREKKQLHPTELGEQVYQFLMKNFSDIINEDFTAKMELSLDEIAEGDRSWKALLHDFYHTFEKDLSKAREDENSYRLPEKKTGEKCPECGADLVIKHGRNGDFIGCSNYPQCRFTKSIVKTLDIPCPRCGGEIVEKVSKRGKVFYGCDQYPECDYASWDKPTGEHCAICGDLLVHRKNRREDRILCHNEECPNHHLEDGKKPISAEFVRAQKKNVHL